MAFAEPGSGEVGAPPPLLRDGPQAVEREPESPGGAGGAHPTVSAARGPARKSASVRYLWLLGIGMAAVAVVVGGRSGRLRLTGSPASCE